VKMIRVPIKGKILTLTTNYRLIELQIKCMSWSKHNYMLNWKKNITEETGLNSVVKKN
jgi:hypothetical protein